MCMRTPYDCLCMCTPQVMDFEDHNMGYDAATGEFCDMVKAGIIDPLKVGQWGLWHGVEDRAC